MAIVRVGQGPFATRLHVEQCGPPVGQAEPLLWITGFAISSEIFAPVVGAYAGRFSCIRYDNRGAGRSSAPWRLTSIPALAGDAVRLLDALGVDSAHVYGLSMGGMVAQEMAIRFPDRVRALVLGGTSHGGPRAVPPAPQVAAALATRGAPSALRTELVARMLFADAYRRSHPAQVQAALANLAAHRATARGLLSHTVAATSHDTRARLPQVQAPTLVLHGQQDRLTPVGNAHRIAALVPDATLAVLPDAAHAYLLEQPEESHRLLVDWLDARSPVRPGRPLRGLAAATEPLTRTLGLQVAALRTSASLASLAAPSRPRPPRR